MTDIPDCDLVTKEHPCLWVKGPTWSTLLGGSNPEHTYKINKHVTNLFCCRHGYNLVQTENEGKTTFTKSFDARFYYR